MDGLNWLQTTQKANNERLISPQFNKFWKNQLHSKSPNYVQLHAKSVVPSESACAF
jgi:hypothetical protein